MNQKITATTNIKQGGQSAPFLCDLVIESECHYQVTTPAIENQYQLLSIAIENHYQERSL